MTKRILVVDDSRLARDMLVFMVTSAGYEADAAEHGAEALERLTEGSHDLALVDINMPVMDGYILIERIRARSELDGLAIVVVSTESQSQDRRRGIEAGANLYLVKPVEQERLLASIGMLIGGPDG